MSQETLSLKSVYMLRTDAADRPTRFRIAAYQRGYRWTPQQVTQLLDDLREFTYRGDPKPEQFYCLQPLVLKPCADGEFEVVDGQQRLTTLLLILRHFNNRLMPEHRLKHYTLEYETREDLLSFLEDPTPARAAANIDYFHIAKAIETIAVWFKSRENEVETIKAVIFNQAKVIWFVLSPIENAVDAFTRLNVGKIPLTNADLIRALFLRREAATAAEEEKMGIAYEWDLLEKGLQRNDFWYFLRNDAGPGVNRIGFLFDLVATAQGMPVSSDRKATFYHYSNRLNAKGVDVNQEWLIVKERYMLLEEWFEDRHLFHLLGFLIWKKTDLNILIALAENTTKRDFKRKLRDRIFAQTIGSQDRAALAPQELRRVITGCVDDLEYGADRQRIRSILLLVNLATLLQNPRSNIRFQFDSFKTEDWHIEHVRSVAADDLRGRPARVGWLEQCRGYLEFAGTEVELQAEIRRFLDLPADDATDAAFGVLYDHVLRAFHEADGDVDDSVSNLVLLDQRTNTSYKNSPFAIKRQRVLALDRHGVFVPLCTRNVFLKVYSPRVDHTMFWTQADRDAYHDAIIEVLTDFFGRAWIDE